MRPFPSVNIFKIQLPLHNHTVRVLLHLFCGNPVSNNKRKYSYSIIGKIEGLKNTEATAEILSAYRPGNQLKDCFIIERNQFIFSNQSLVPAIFNVKICLKGILSTDCFLTADISIEMTYTLKQLLVNCVTSRYCLKNIREPVSLLMQ